MNSEKSENPSALQSAPTTPPAAMRLRFCQARRSPKVALRAARPAGGRGSGAGGNLVLAETSCCIAASYEAKAFGGAPHDAGDSLNQ